MSAQSYTLLNTLYVFAEPSWLHLDNDTVRVDVERETKLRVPLHHLQSIVVHGDGLVTPALIARCAERGIGIALLSRSGRFVARVEGPLTGNVYLRRDQFAAMNNSATTLALAKSFVAGKVRNARTVLMRAFRESSAQADRAPIEAAARHLNASLRSLKVATQLDEVRGIEGDAAKTYFNVFGLFVRPDLRATFPLDGRSRRPPRNAMNAMLSYLYAVITHDCRSALESVGLDPQVGFLHALRPGRPALALDLVEEFRAVLGDRVALKLINRGQVKPGDLHASAGGAWELLGDARKLVLSAYQERKRESIRHPVLDADVPIGLLPQIQARLLARRIRGELQDYVPYLHR